MSARAQKFIAAIAILSLVLTLLLGYYIYRTREQIAAFPTIPGESPLGGVSTENTTNLTNLVLSEDLWVTQLLIPDNYDYSPSATPEEVNLDPAYTFYNITPAAAITITLLTTSAVAGQLLIIYNTANYNLLIPDTNILTSTGSALTLGQYDIVGWIYNGSKWVEMFLLANS